MSATSKLLDDNCNTAAHSSHSNLSRLPLPLTPTTLATTVPTLITSNNKSTKCGAVCSHSNARILTIFLGIYFTQAIAGGILIPTYGAYWFAGCISNDSTITINDESCSPDYASYNLFNTIFVSIGGALQFLFTAFCGRLSDSFGRKLFILLCVLSYAIPRTVIIFYVNLYLYFALGLFTDIPVFAFSAAFADIFHGSQSLKTVAYSLLYAMAGLGLFLGAAWSVIISFIWDNHTVFISLAFVYALLFLIWTFGIQETLSRDLRKPFTTKNYNPFRPLLKIGENEIILYCSLISFVLEFDNIAVLSIILPFVGDQFDLKGEFETNAIFAALSVVGGIGNVLQGVLLMPYLKKRRKMSNLSILIIGCLARIIGLYLLAMSVVLYDYRISVSVAGCFILGIGSIGRPANIGIVSHYLHRREQGVGLGVVDSYKSLAKVIAPASMGYVYWLFSDSELPSMHWYICIALRLLILTVILGPFHKVLTAKNAQQPPVVVVEDTDIDGNENETELVLPTVEHDKS